MAICNAKDRPAQPKAGTLVFTAEGGTKSWRRRSTGMDTQRESLLNGCDDWEFSAHLSEWNKILKVIQDARMRPDILFHSKYYSTNHHD
ncbi:reverse transcriptase [Plakobranchus ocellatus]|uniref:Reverse transcriptase n=1 Tax=Plakobranchus ocellatus TaxID=259542 RepID=A0AAV4E0A1_9GAST|nr:reverse transcriptase [Plakobranchus ocellatus]